jgi:hypothetical protein
MPWAWGRTDIPAGALGKVADFRPAAMNEVSTEFDRHAGKAGAN